MVDSANIAQISSSCIQLLSVLSAEPLSNVSVLILFNKRWDSHTSAFPQLIFYTSKFSLSAGLTHIMCLEESSLSHCLFSDINFKLPSRDMPCIMSLVEIKSLFRMDDIIASATQPITILEVGARSGEGLQEVLSWLESITVKWYAFVLLWF